MGGDQAPVTITWLAKVIKERYPELKVGWYSGKKELSKDIIKDYFDYIKIGPYMEDKGPLNFPTTNQRFYEKEDGKWYDVTYKFWKNDKNPKIARVPVEP